MSDSVEMSNLGAGKKAKKGKDEIGALLTSAEGALTSMGKARLQGGDKELNDRLATSGKALVGGLRKEFGKGAYGAMATRISEWKDQNADDLDLLEQRIKKGVGLSPVVTLIGYLDQI
jgi:hypothetical protein